MIFRLGIAFCVATVLAELSILGLVFAKGNLNSESIFKVTALLNGIDITGDKLQQMFDDATKTPPPEYEDIVRERAAQSRTLEMRERSINMQAEQLNAERIALTQKETAFDRRKDEFYALIDKMSQDTGAEGLKEVQRT
ncbi:MAG: hypothetical protein KDB03_13275, partial [Planctomycetales bacterium]|nr:hypothetical protein [Planctomycetales bacterium]